MKKIISCTFAIGFMLVLAGTSFARPSGEVKASPLYQQSLQQSIAQMDGKVEVSAGSNQVAAAGLLTSSNVCPAVPYTQQYTCTPTAQGGYTCAYTCTNTCASTCASTCQGATCTAPTCQSTCVPGPCSVYVQGTVWWYNVLYQRFHNWDSDGTVDLYEPRITTSFRASDGYYHVECAPNASDMYASGYAGPRDSYVGGVATKPAQSPGTTVNVDIQCGLAEY